MSAVAIGHTTAHRHSALCNGHETVRVSGGAVGIAGSVVDRGGPHGVCDGVAFTRDGVDSLVDVGESASICVLQDAGLTFPVDDGDFTVVSAPSGDGVVDNGAIQGTVHRTLTNGRRSSSSSSDAEVVEVCIVARLAVQTEGGHRCHCSVRARHNCPAAVNLRADAVLAVRAVAVGNAAAHLDGALYDGQQTVGVGGGAIRVASSVVDRGGPDLVLNIVDSAGDGVDGLVDVRETASVCVLQDASLTFPVDDGDFTVVGAPSGDGVVDYRPVEVAVHDHVPLTSDTRAHDRDRVKIRVVARLTV